MDAQALSTLCGVSLATAYRWLKNPSAIPTPARHLIALIESGRVLPTSWRGCRFDNGQLITHTGEAMNQQQIEQWRLYCDWWRQATKENDFLKEYIAYLESCLPKADVIKLKNMRESLTEGKELNPFFQKTTN